jgi:DNA-directed RNA polymerase subunit RPC12/RpoP
MARIRGIKRLKIMMEKLFKCEECGKTPKVLIIHHKDFNKDNDDPENLELLCPYCHFKKHLKGKPKNKIDPTGIIIKNDD